MKKLALTTVIALGVAAPALAQSQLEQQFGTGFTIGELALLKDVSTEESNEGRVFLGNEKIRFSAMNQHNDAARAIFDRLAEEARDND